MNILEASTPGALVLILLSSLASSCDSKPAHEKTGNEMNEEIATIDSLLRDKNFSESMANSLDSAYYAGIGEAQPTFLHTGSDSTTPKSAREEKIAIKMAGFYALECGIGLLSEQSGTTPVQWLQKISDKTLDSNSILLLNRFANATWKAGQPFRDLNRVTRPVFMVASLLTQEEVDKDYFQIFYSAKKLLSSMQPVSKSPLEQQMQKLRQLLQDTAYALEMASYLHLAPDTIQQVGKERFLSPADDTATVRKNVNEIKIATSLAGFYALECCLNYLVTTTRQLPSAILQSLKTNSISKEDKMLFARFANATWKAGQPFRGLNRISRATFTPFYFLSEPDIEKDLVQIRAAASRLLAFL
jgi:hypothetical protein